MKKLLVWVLLSLSAVFASVDFPHAPTVGDMLKMSSHKVEMTHRLIVSTIMVSMNQTRSACFLGRELKAFDTVRNDLEYARKHIHKYKGVENVDYAYFAFASLQKKMPCYKPNPNLYH